MNEFLKQFQSIKSSVKLLTTNDNESVEIQTSATKLNDSVEICLKEMRESAEKLQPLIKNCYQDLEQAEDVWQSKGRILDVSHSEIWDQISQLTAIDARIHQLQQDCQTQVIQEIVTSWEQCFERLKTKWFIDAKSGNLKGNVGLSDKDGLVNDLKSYFQIINKKVREDINNYIEKVCQNFIVNIPLLESHINCLNTEERLIAFPELILAYNNKRNQLEEFINSYYSPFGSLLDDFINSGFIVISWPQFYDFSKKVKGHAQESILEKINENFKSSLEIIEIVINFYRIFLETKNRYQQETPEQREAEKIWIEEQCQKLETVESELMRFSIMAKLGLDR